MPKILTGIMEGILVHLLTEGEQYVSRVFTSIRDSRGRRYPANVVQRSLERLAERGFVVYEGSEKSLRDLCDALAGRTPSIHSIAITIRGRAMANLVLLIRLVPRRNSLKARSYAAKLERLFRRLPAEICCSG